MEKRKKLKNVCFLIKSFLINQILVLIENFHSLFTLLFKNSRNASPKEFLPPLGGFNLHKLRNSFLSLFNSTGLIIFIILYLSLQLSIPMESPSPNSDYFYIM